MLGAYKKVDHTFEITHQDCSSGHLRSSLINKWNSHKIDEKKHKKAPTLINLKKKQ
jgi:hypothetical protein